MNKTTKALIDAAIEMRSQLSKLKFTDPISHVYNPLDYAWSAHEKYIKTYATKPVQCFFLGMNPGPWGMAQTGVPFGEINAVVDWLGIKTAVDRPKNEHPKRPIEGFECTRSEVSGRRLWGLFSEKFETPAAFFERHYVSNYCPLVFMDEGARNITPDKIRVAEVESLTTICDTHLARCLEILKPEWAIGIGAFAEQCFNRAAKHCDGKVKWKTGKILHPSPASPAANRDWAGTATRQLKELGIW